MIPRVVRFASAVLFLLPIAACKPAVQSAPQSAPQSMPPAQAAEAIAVPARPAEAEGLVAGLRDATGGSVDASRVDAYLDRHFRGQCVDGDPRLSFDRICQHYPQQAGEGDPSPWPDAVVGIKDGRIVSAVITGATDALGAAWRCAAASGFEGMRLCHVATAPKADRTRWSAEWTAYFASGD